MFLMSPWLAKLCSRAAAQVTVVSSCACGSQYSAACWQQTIDRTRVLVGACSKYFCNGAFFTHWLAGNDESANLAVSCCQWLCGTARQ